MDMQIIGRIGSIVLGYALGNFLTAFLVTRIVAHKSPTEIGSHNPGMANVMAQLGFVPGVAVLAGDLAKTILAVVLANLFFPQIGHFATLYAAVGATLGHNFPLWQHFRGGKGVAVTVVLVILYNPFWGGDGAAGGTGRPADQSVPESGRYRNSNCVCHHQCFCVPAGDNDRAGVADADHALALLGRYFEHCAWHPREEEHSKKNHPIAD